jgi:hypothetical protein
MATIRHWATLPPDGDLPPWHCQGSDLTVKMDARLPTRQNDLKHAFIQDFWNILAMATSNTGLEITRSQSTPNHIPNAFYYGSTNDC